ncbi:MAG: ATP-dependent Clp protease proteolytic subunit [Chthoniobacterales bacterium]
MANWSEILEEVKASQEPAFDSVRQKHLAHLSSVTGRNTIAFYSGWLQRPSLQGAQEFSINDGLMTGLMTVINKLDRKKGLDLVLHTPGGEINATEAIVDYLRYAFSGDIRAIVPHQAMSAGTMIALSCNRIVMGMHSSLGPVDPQINGAPAHGILEEFRRIEEAFSKNPSAAQVWVPILQKYTPTLIGACEKAAQLSEHTVAKWLETGMFAGEADAKKRSMKVIEELGSHQRALNHGRHYAYEKIRSLGIYVDRLEDDAPLQDAVLSLHHAFTITLTATPAVHIIENQIGAAFVNQIVSH